jgi:hypothetical protein
MFLSSYKKALSVFQNYFNLLFPDFSPNLPDSFSISVSAIYRSACTAPRIFETQDEGQRQCMGLQYRKREQGRQCEFRCLRR